MSRRSAFFLDLPRFQISVLVLHLVLVRPHPSNVLVILSAAKDRLLQFTVLRSPRSAISFDPFRYQIPVLVAPQLEAGNWLRFALRTITDLSAFFPIIFRRKEQKYRTCRCTTTFWSPHK